MSETELHPLIYSFLISSKLKKTAKDFVKELTFKLNEWTGQRWIIALSKKTGQPSKKQNKDIEKSKIIEDAKNQEFYKKILELFPDAELTDVKLKDNE